jgi:hypothetical protein
MAETTPQRKTDIGPPHYQKFLPPIVSTRRRDCRAPRPGARWSVVGDREFDVAEGKVMPAADVHGVAFAALGAQVIHDLEIGDDEGAAPPGDGDRVAVALSGGKEGMWRDPNSIASTSTS